VQELVVATVREEVVHPTVAAELATVVEEMIVPAVEVVVATAVEVATVAEGEATVAEEVIPPTVAEEAAIVAEELIPLTALIAAEEETAAVVATRLFYLGKGDSFEKHTVVGVMGIGECRVSSLVPYYHINKGTICRIEEARLC